jgi:hypothetical protein
MLDERYDDEYSTALNKARAVYRDATKTETENSPWSPFFAAVSIWDDIGEVIEGWSANNWTEEMHETMRRDTSKYEREETKEEVKEEDVTMKD